MAYPIFAYLVVIVFAANPAAAASVQEQGFQAIFSAVDENHFVTALNNFFDENLTKSNINSNLMVVKGDQGTFTNEPLQDSFSITEHIDNLVNAREIQFYVQLGSTLTTTLKVEIKQTGGSFDQITTVTATSSANSIVLNQLITGSLDITITGISTDPSDAFRTLLVSDITTMGNVVVAPTSSYYHTYQYTVPGTCKTKVFIGGGQWYWYYYSCTLTETGWETSTLSTVPAINVISMTNSTYQYQTEAKQNGYYPVVKKIYYNGALVDTLLEGYVDYSTMTGYNGTNPNFLTDGVPLDQYLIGLLSYEGLLTNSFDANSFLGTLMTFVQNSNPDNEPVSAWQSLEDEFSTLMYPINGPNDPSHLTKYVLGEYTYTGNTLVYGLGLYQQTWVVTQVCVQYEKIPNDQGGWDNVCVQYGPGTTTQLGSVQLMGILGPSSNLGFPSSQDNVLILKTQDMAGYPQNPYFFNWLLNLATSKLGITYPSSVTDQLQASSVASPLTKTNVSLVLDPNAPTGVSPYVADISVTDTNGNAANGNLPVTVKDSAGNVLTTGTIVNGTASLTLPYYNDTVSATVSGNSFYTGSEGTGTVQYNLMDMIQTQGAPGTDPVANAKWQIIRDYIVNSTAFDYDSTSGNYTMNNNDAANLWVKDGVNVGYVYGSPWSVSQHELDSGKFDNEIISVTEMYNSGGIQEGNNIYLTKMQFFDLWLGMKLAPAYTGDNPPGLTYYTQLDSLAENYSTLLHEPQSFFTNGGSTAKNFVSLVLGDLKTATELKFPTASSTSWWQGLISLANTLINDFMSLVNDAWQFLVNHVLSGINWIMSLWNEVVAPVMGPITEMEKNVATIEVNFVVDTVWNDIVQPLLPLNGDMSLSNNFQNFLNIIIDPSAVNSWTSTMKEILDPFTSRISINVENNIGSFSSLSNELGIFSLISNFFGMDQVNYAINALENRITEYLCSWLNSFPQNATIVNDFANQFSINDTLINQIKSLSTESGSYGDLTKSSTIITLPAFLSLPTMDAEGTLLDSVVQVPAPSGYASIIKLGSIGLSIIAAILVEGIFAYSIIFNHLLLNDLPNLLTNFFDLPNMILNNQVRATQILFDPQSTQDQTIRDIACLEATKMGMDTFLFLGGLYKDNIQMKYSLQIAQTLVFALGGWVFSIDLNAQYALLNNIVVPDFFNMPTAVFVNIITSGFCILWNVAGLALMQLKLLDQNQLITQFFGGFQILCALLAWGISAYLTGSLNKLDSFYNDLIFLTSITSYAIKGYLFYTNLAGEPPTSNPYVLGAVTLLATSSDYIQAYSMFNEFL